jgi:branched-chain amino acid transport system permease protein
MRNLPVRRSEGSPVGPGRLAASTPRPGRGWLTVLLPPLIATAVFVLLPDVYGNTALLFTMMVYLALAQGINLLYGFTGYLPFGYVGFFGTGAYAASLAMLDLHVPPVLAVLLGAAAAALLGLLLAPLLRLAGAYFALASLAASQAVYFIVANPNLQGITHGPYGLSLASVFDPTGSYLTMVAVLAASLALVAHLRRSRLGLALRAIRDDSDSAAMAGIDVGRVRTAAWLLSALLAGATGGVFAWQISVFYPQAVFSLSTSILAIVFTLFGGSGTLIGPVIGTVLLYGLYNAIGLSAPEFFQLSYGLLIVVLVLFLPDGITSLLHRRGFHVL